MDIIQTWYSSFREWLCWYQSKKCYESFFLPNYLLDSFILTSVTTQLNELCLKINNKKGKKNPFMVKLKIEKTNSKGTKEGEEVKCFCGCNKRFCGFHDFSLLVVSSTWSFFLSFRTMVLSDIQKCIKRVSTGTRINISHHCLCMKIFFFRSINKSFILLLVVCTDMKNAHIFVVCSFWLR